MEKKQKKLWEKPWGYLESFLIAGALLVAGFIIELTASDFGLSLPGWPYNFFILLAYINVLVLSYFLYRNSTIVKWFSQVPAAVSAITIFTVLILMMGFTKQEDSEASGLILRLGLSHVTRSWPYLIISVYFLSALGFVTLRRMIPFKTKNIWFLVNHLGLFILMVAASLGTGDLMRLQMNLKEGETTNVATDDDGSSYEMPFAIKLNDFKISEYPPKAGIVDMIQGGIAGKEHESYFEVNEGYEGSIGNTKFKIVKYLPDAAPFEGQYAAFDGEGSAPAAFVLVMNQQGDSTTSGWICSGNAFQERAVLSIDSRNGLVMLPPTAKEYSSVVEVISQEGKEEHELIVNKPIFTNGWKVYQVGYDDRYGKHSKLSVVEVVRDPWLNVVYLGIFMVIAGALYIFWIGRGEKINS